MDIQKRAIDELSKESPTARRWFRNHGTDYMAMPSWLRERLTAKRKAVEEVCVQLELPIAQ